MLRRHQKGDLAQDRTRRRSSQQGYQNVPPDGANHGGNPEMNGSPRIPVSGDKQNPERSAPGRGNASRPPMQPYREEQNSYGELDDHPAEPAIGPADRQVDESARSVYQHDPDPGSEECEDVPCLPPLRPQQQSNHVPSHQAQHGPRTQSHKGEDGQPVQKITPILGRSTFEPAQGGKHDVSDRNQQLVRRQQKQIIGLLVKPERSWTKPPSNQQVVSVSREVVKAKTTVDMHGKANDRGRSRYRARQTRDPLTRAPSPDGLDKRPGNDRSHQCPVSPSCRSQADRNDHRHDV